MSVLGHFPAENAWLTALCSGQDCCLYRLFTSHLSLKGKQSLHGLWQLESFLPMPQIEQSPERVTGNFQACQQLLASDATTLLWEYPQDRKERKEESSGKYLRSPVLTQRLPVAFKLSNSAKCWATQNQITCSVLSHCPFYSDSHSVTPEAPLRGDLVFHIGTK